MEENRLYTPSEAAQKLGITTGLLNKWVLFFEFETEWTKENQTGHRRYTQEQLEGLVRIKEKVQDQNWSWEKTKAFLQGDETVNQELKTSLEAKVDNQTAMIQELMERIEKQEQFNQALVGQLTKLTDYVEHQLVTRIEAEQRDSKLIESLRDSMQETKNQAAASAASAASTSGSDDAVLQKRAEKEKEIENGWFFSFFNRKKKKKQG